MQVTQLDFEDAALVRLALPGGDLNLVRGIGSGLTLAHDGTLWGLGDRGPNLKVPLAIAHHGPSGLEPLAGLRGAKVMPLPAAGPALARLRLEGDRVVCETVLYLRDRNGRPLSGLPVAAGMGEVAVDLDGRELAPDPGGADTEGVAALADGGFWVTEEYGPSLLRVAADGEVRVRWVPAGTQDLYAGAAYPVAGVLPAIAAARQFNRGFEGIALSPDETRIYLAFQSPLAHPDEATHSQARHVRLWTLDASTGALLAQHLYPLDPPDSFRRDLAQGPVAWCDLKISELVTLACDCLLVLERGSATTKFYTVRLDGPGLAPDHIDPATRPTAEQLSAAGAAVPELAKTVVFSTDDMPQIGHDLEGVVKLGPRSLLLVNDNDLGVEGVATRFWRVELDADL
ncbi:hypothetical protein ABAC460_05785 [Asticcacaulis sp. AC460]|uniref:esterase-like activity of phytase family protein n=1 Tax=Asticcacaulis sp. AC460 TaxID=1282360 RepID=UPI0003C3FB25|nr:esterase-like activity of phytase family protein [Asticcacaulis sp. AC460]ESQ91494.1 hypothetical protein ABAC460_05785 [Asticcacaulis sp. AC460]